MINYLNFSENQVFSSPLLNTSFNQFYTFLINNFSEAVLFDLMIDGNVAKALQNITVSDISTLEILTTNKKVFEFLKHSYAALNVSQVLVDVTSVSFVINNYNFKVKYSSETISPIVVQGVFVKPY